MQLQFPRSLKEVDWLRTLVLAVVLIGMGAYALNWYFPPADQRPVFQPVKQIIEKKVSIPGPTQIRVVEKTIVQKEFPSLVVPESSRVITTAQLPKLPAGGKAVTTMDMTTGESSTQVLPDKPTFFGFPNEAEVMVRYGVSAKDGQAGSLAARYTFLRMGNVNVSAYGEIDTPRTDAKAMIEAAYKF